MSDPELRASLAATQASLSELHALLAETREDVIGRIDRAISKVDELLADMRQGRPSGLKPREQD